MSQTLLQRLTNFLPLRFRRGIPLVPVVRLTGVIGFSTPLSPGMTLASVSKTLERAFSIKQARAVALVINSPGGSAVQSHLIHRRIRSLADEHKKRVIAVVEDVRRPAAT
jgi:serine protease SohB